MGLLPCTTVPLSSTKHQGHVKKIKITEKLRMQFVGDGFDIAKFKSKAYASNRKHK